MTTYRIKFTLTRKDSVYIDAPTEQLALDHLRLLVAREHEFRGSMSNVTIEEKR